MSENIQDNLRSLLKLQNAEFVEISHQPTYTSEESAAARGESLKIGAKALLLKIGENFKLIVIPADKKLDSAALKQHFNVKKTRFASPEELYQLTGLVPGSVPPFGNPILPFELYADRMVGERTEKIAFNAGSLTDSIVMKGDQWVRIANPTFIRCAI